MDQQKPGNKKAIKVTDEGVGKNDCNTENELQVVEGEKDPWRPTKYKKEYDEQVRKLCLLGAIDTEIADLFGVDERTINRWKVDYPGFCQSIKEGKIMAASFGINESTLNILLAVSVINN